jgi:6-phosphogluconate dehydrogenase
VAQGQDAWRKVSRPRSSWASRCRPWHALAYYDGYRSERLPANLLQAQRDYFGAHTYERVDKPRGEFFHTNWTGRGGSSTTSA